jgi:hydroxyacylglutathione hydrolase
MKKLELFAAVSLLFLINCISASAQVFKNADLVISKLEENTWIVETTDNNTMYIIEGEKKAMLIDTGTKCAKLDSIVRLITKKPLYVVLTHLHGDHAGNLDQFNEVWFQPADTVLLKWVRPYKGKIHFIKDDDVFDLGKRKIVVKHMPGHTPGSIVLLDKKTGNCYSGDAFGSGQVWLQLRPFAPMKTYIASCEKMEKLMDDGITKIYCGHYHYVKKAFDKSFISVMRKLAQMIDNGTVTGVKPYQTKVSIGGDHPMIATLGDASIVYDSEHIK